MALPTVTPEQQQAALKKAQETRAARSRVKKDLKRGASNPAIVLSNTSDPVIGRIKVKQFLQSLPGVGAARAKVIMEKCSIIDENKRLQGLGSKQKELIVAQLSK